MPVQKKVKELNENSHSQFLFYDSKRMIQLLILSKVKEIHHQESTYNIIPDANKKIILVFRFLVRPIEGPDIVGHDFSKSFFTKIIFQSSSLEYLRLKRPNHIRAIFNSDDLWSGQFLAP
jgi:hypothetical protein